MVHSVKSIFPFDLAEAMFLVPLPSGGTFTTTDLIAWCPHQLQKRELDLDVIKDKVVASRFKSIHNFEQHFCMSIKSYEFVPGTLVLVRNSKVEYELSKKTKLGYLGPMVVVHCTKGGSYMLTEPDSVISKLRFTMFRIIPYYPHSEDCVSIAQMTGIDDDRIDQLEAGENIEPEEDDPECTYKD